MLPPGYSLLISSETSGVGYSLKKSLSKRAVLKEIQNYKSQRDQKPQRLTSKEFLNSSDDATTVDGNDDRVNKSRAEGISKQGAKLFREFVAKRRFASNATSEKFPAEILSEVRDGKMQFDGTSVHEKFLYKVCREADKDNTKDNNPAFTECANPKCSALLVKDLNQSDFLEAETKYIGTGPINSHATVLYTRHVLKIVYQK